MQGNANISLSIVVPENPGLDLGYFIVLSLLKRNYLASAPDMKN